ncbi:MAG: cytochrome c maturation protein CcmE [Actinomycetota bacterium]|nr:cytochrome c maturation protein CcmE [Actinomycetota bacterium]
MAVTHHLPPGGGAGDFGDSGDFGEGEASADAGPVGPPIGAVIRPRARLGSRRRQVMAFGIIAAALAVLLFRGLGNATVYFKTADEAVAQRAQLGSHRFRIEGTVQPGVHQLGPNVAFAIANNGVSVDVTHHSGAPQLFKPGIPVVLEGHFASDGHFDSDLIMVKHTASYDAQHPERATTVPSPSPTP